MVTSCHTLLMWMCFSSNSNSTGSSVALENLRPSAAILRAKSHREGQGNHPIPLAEPGAPAFPDPAVGRLSPMQGGGARAWCHPHPTPAWACGLWLGQYKPRQWHSLLFHTSCSSSAFPQRECRGKSALLFVTDMLSIT